MVGFGGSQNELAGFSLSVALPGIAAFHNGFRFWFIDITDGESLLVLYRFYPFVTKRQWQVQASDC
jgi:hypothetical protein